MEEPDHDALSNGSIDSRNVLVPKVSSPFQEHDTEYNKWKSYSFKISSYFFTTLFLTLLMIGAMFHRLFLKLTGRKEKFVVDPDTYQQAYPESSKLKIIPDLRYYINLLGLDLLEYKLTTPDGFVIRVQRIIDNQQSEEERNSKKPVLCVHGLLQCSASFATSGFKSLAYLLHSNNYDVWLGNNRCGFEPQHLFYEPKDPKMWEWDIQDMATKDLPTMINHITSISNHDKLSLMCHSQGTTQTFIALSKHFIPDQLNPKVEHFIALAPAVYGGPILDTKIFIKFINCLSPMWYSIFFGIHSFMPIMMDFRHLIYQYKIFGFLAYSMFNFLFDWNDSLWDPKIIHQHFLFSPVYVSSQLMKWWLSQNGFVNNKEILPDEDHWFSELSPSITLFVAKEDRLVDGERLIRHFKNHEPHLKTFNYVELEMYAHLDVLWADDVNIRIGKPLLEILSST